MANKTKPLLKQHSIWHPDFFLASVSERYWKPCAVAVTRNDQVVGIVYAKERLFARCPTGIIYSDATLGTTVAADPVHREQVLGIAIRSLITSSKARALRIVLPGDAFDHWHVSNIAAVADMDIACFQVENHSRLPLPSSYDDFLKGLGAHTRRNFRYYRKRFEAGGAYFVGHVPFERFCDAAWQLKRKSTIRTGPNAIKRSLAMLSAVSDPLLVGLQASNGEWLSVAGGWCDNGRATLVFQINDDKEYPRASLSQVLRSYLIEQLIARRIHDLVFWAGNSAPLVRYAQIIPATALYLDSRRPGWRLLRWVVRSLGSLLPQRLMKFAEWIAPVQ